VNIHAGENELTRLRVEERPGHAEVYWADAEDVVRGTLTPFPIRAGTPFTVSLVVGTVQGEDFSGPVTVALRPLADLGGTESATVARRAGERAWVHVFTPKQDGEHRLEVSFRTTHLKVARGVIPVAEAKLPRWLSYAIGGGLIAASVSVGVWLTFRRRGGVAAS
jgi:hypothetical protein